jgi:DNA-binding transcriptional LysR family regulator
MELRQLRYFVAVADELHFTKAATRLNVSRPAVSQGVAALEKSLGVRLFDRTPRSIALTPAGRALAPHARQVLDHADRAQQAVLPPD